jgi:hypothetical protein
MEKEEGRRRSMRHWNKEGRGRDRSDEYEEDR